MRLHVLDKTPRPFKDACGILKTAPRSFKDACGILKTAPRPYQGNSIALRRHIHQFTCSHRLLMGSACIRSSNGMTLDPLYRTTPLGAG
jgi:hypothetical protein